jgi:signal transduction histidine kinase
VASALVHENAWLQGAAQRARTQFQALAALAAAMARKPDLPAVLALIARSAGALLAHGAGSVWLWDAAAELLRPQPPADGTGRPLRLGEGVPGMAAETRRPVLVRDYPSSPQRLAAHGVSERVTAMMGAPLIYGEALLGALVVDNGVTGQPYSPEDAALLESVAAQASIAIASTRLAASAEADGREVQRLSRRLVEVQEAERRALARELHDEIGQALTGLRLLLEGVTGDPAPGSRAALQAAPALVAGLLDRVRRLALDLRPSLLDDLGLLPALCWHVERYQAQTGIAVELRHTGLDDRRLGPELETAAYRVVQEALTNIARHAGVREAAVRLWLAGGVLGVQVEDGGRGFDPAALAGRASSGLSGMRERVALLAGRLSIESAPESGTCIWAEFPCAKADAAQ